MQKYDVKNLDEYDKWVLNLDQTNPEPACDQDCNDCPGKSSVNCCENRNIGDLNFREGAD